MEDFVLDMFAQGRVFSTRIGDPAAFRCGTITVTWIVFCGYITLDADIERRREFAEKSRQEAGLSQLAARLRDRYEGELNRWGSRVE